ncbi:MAG: pitrilysin family protein [Sulfurovaceae bacterium]|nr:pitrilysin family protein [Sulfurovaceae bacterium]
MAATITDIDIKGEKVPFVFEESSQLPIVSLQIVFQNSGQLNTSHDGLAEMSAKLLGEGTKSDGSIVFATKLEDKAIQISAYTSRENFIIVVSSLKSEFKDATLLLKDLLKDPNYTAGALSKIKRQKQGWLNQKKSDFDYQAGVLLRQTLFASTPLARPYEGTEESIKSISLKDIRSFINTHLGYNNAIVVMGGDITQKEAETTTKDILTLLPKVDTTPLTAITASSEQKINYIYNDDTRQAYIYFGSPFDYSYQNKDQYKAKIMEYILGSAGFGSRIMEEIRVKRGLAYSAYASLQRTKISNYLTGYLQTKLENEEGAKALVKEVISEFVTKGITKEELEDAKEFLVGSEALRNETLSQRLNRTFDDYYYGRPQDFSKEQNEKIMSVTLKEMNEFIAAHPEITKLSFGIVTKK